MKIFWIIAAHAIAIVLLLRVGLSFNDAIVQSQNRYAGVLIIFSVLFGLYTTALNFLYQRNLAFHLFVNRLRLRLSPTYTYWQPHVTMMLDSETAGRTSLLDEIWQMLSSGEHGSVMLTRRGGVVLQQNYQDIGLELELVMDVQEKLLKHVWHERKQHAKSDDELPDDV